MPESPFRPTQLRCPKCDGVMPLQALPEADAYRCEVCFGLWLPLNAHRHLDERAEALDVGRARGEPASSSPAHHWLCPTCPGDLELIDMVDIDDAALHYESCHRCHGRFYDAGEFRQLAEANDDWIDWLRERLR